MVRFDMLLINRIRPDGTLLNVHLHATITGREAVEIVRKWRYCIACGYGFIGFTESSSKSRCEMA